MVNRIDFASDKATEICRKALGVFGDLRNGDLETPLASELSNALGKANGAIGHLLKAEALEQDAKRRSVDD